jgi:4a-hydroxytetrahydrobiopterin dehydratase
MVWKEEGILLVKDFEFKDFSKAVDFVNKIAKVAEKADHHPNILIHSYNKVRITLTTHSENKITEKDRKLAKEIDKIKM